MRIPERGEAWPALSAALDAAKARDVSWRRGRMAVFFYWLDEETERVGQEAYRRFWTENNLGQRAFPSLATLEGEVVAMALDLLHAPEGAGGTFTSGGSESIFLAMLAAREKAGAQPGSGGNVVMPDTAHLTFDRACWYLGLEARRVPVTADRVADVTAMAAAMDGRTVALVGSAPCYPFGTVDPVAGLGTLARERGVWLHVDACVGGFLNPFLAGLPAWDFSAHAGVASISADIHKHGMAPKGASLLLVRDAALKAHHRFESRAWARGLYAAHTAQGTRPGGAVAAAWAVMRHLGLEGYRRCARQIMAARAEIAGGIAAIPGLEALPGSHAILVYRSTDPALPVAAVAEGLERRGWLVSRQAEPEGIHLHLNPLHAEVAADYVAALREATAEARGAAPARREEARAY